MLKLPCEIQWYIWKLYFTQSVLPNLPTQADCMNLKIYYKTRVLPQLLVYTVGDHIAKLINHFIDNFPLDPEVLTNTIENWDYIYYALLDAHAGKKSDLFLFVSLKDAIQSLHIET